MSGRAPGTPDPGIRRVLAIRPFRRLWLVLGLSSLGDWVGLLATSTFAAGQVSGQSAQGLAFGGVIAVRLLPALVFGPVAAVVADRFDRRVTLVVCDLLRFAFFASIPVVGLLAAAPAVVVGWAAVATFCIESVSMVWAPVKDATVPNLVPHDGLEAANQLSLATTYGITPVLGGLSIALLNRVASVVQAHGAAHGFDPVDVPLYFTALTFLANAAVVWFGVREIGGRGGRPSRDGAGPVTTLRVGWEHVRRDPLVRGLIGGITVAFAAAGVVIGTARFYAAGLHGGDATFFVLFGVLFAGLGIGISAGPAVARARSRRDSFAVAIVAAGASVVVLALAPVPAVALVAALGTGASAGVALLSATTMLGGETEDTVRGRVFAFLETSSRFTLVLTIVVSSVVVGLCGTRRVDVLGATAAVSTTRLLLLAAGIVTAVAGLRDLSRVGHPVGDLAGPSEVDSPAALVGPVVRAGTSDPAVRGRTGVEPRTGQREPGGGRPDTAPEDHDEP